MKENHSVIYYNLLTQGKLNLYLHDIEIRAKERYTLLVNQLVENQSITEQLKSENQMLWVRKMNGISNQVREELNREIILTI